MKEYRVGLLGMGMIGTVHAHCISTLPYYYQGMPFRAVLAGVYNRTYETAAQAKAQYGFEFAAKTMDELIERDDIDVIDICLPNHQHEQCIIAALESGKHVYCEKPLCVSHEGAQRILEAAKKSDRKIQMAFNNRFFPAIMRAKQIVDEGRLGRLLSFSAVYTHASNIDPGKPHSWRCERAYTGGGAMMDLGSHVIDLITHLGGKFSRVNAVLQTGTDKRPCGDGMKAVDVEDAAYIMGELKCGAMGTITASKLVTGTNEELLIQLNGEAGAIRFDAESPGWLAFYDNTAPGGSFGGDRGFKYIEACQRFNAPGGSVPPPKMTLGWIRSHVHSMYSFFENIHSGKACNPSLEDGAYNQYLLGKAYESANSGVWVDV